MLGMYCKVKLGIPIAVVETDKSPLKDGHHAQNGKKKMEEEIIKQTIEDYRRDQRDLGKAMKIIREIKNARVKCRLEDVIIDCVMSLGDRINLLKDYLKETSKQGRTK